MNGQNGDLCNNDQEINNDQCCESQQIGTEQFKKSLETHNDQKSQDEQNLPHQQSSQLSSSSSSFSSSHTDQSSSNQNNNSNHHFVPRTKLFVGRLPESCSSKHLEDLFGKYGTVTECDVVGRYGFVHMSKPEEADECVKKLNRYSFMGSLLTVEFSTSKVHLEPGTLGRAKGVSRISKGVRPRIHNHTPYHRESFNNHRPNLGLSHSAQLPPPHPHPTIPAPPPPGRLYVGYSQAYYPDSYRPCERDIYYDSDYYGRDRDRHYPLHDHISSGSGGVIATGNYDFDRGYSSPPPPPSSIGHPAPHHTPYPIYPSHRSLPIRAYERPVIDEPMPMYSSRGSSMTPHKCHYHKCHYDVHVKPY